MTLLTRLEECVHDWVQFVFKCDGHSIVGRSASPLSLPLPLLLP
jgi:hypothetical protein